LYILGEGEVIEGYRWYHSYGEKFCKSVHICQSCDETASVVFCSDSQCKLHNTGSWRHVITLPFLCNYALCL